MQHLKLCAVLDIVRLTQPDDGRRYYAPWRGDPRPAAGLLQGAYAYLGVTEFWRRQRALSTGTAQLKADSEFARWRAGTSAPHRYPMLSSGRLRPIGLEFVQRMSETASRWSAEWVPARARRRSRATQVTKAIWPGGNASTDLYLSSLAARSARDRRRVKVEIDP